MEKKEENKKMQILTKVEDISKIAEKIGKIKNVKAVYLFGSHAREKQTPLSDIDLCVIGNLIEKDKSEIAGYGSDNLDISFFDELPIHIKFRVFKEGKVLIVKDEKFLDRLKVMTVRLYLDFKYVINRYCKEVLGCTI